MNADVFGAVLLGMLVSVLFAVAFGIDVRRKDGVPLAAMDAILFATIPIGVAFVVATLYALK